MYIMWEDRNVLRGIDKKAALAAIFVLLLLQPATSIKEKIESSDNVEVKVERTFGSWIEIQVENTINSISETMSSMLGQNRDIDRSGVQVVQ